MMADRSPERLARAGLCSVLEQGDPVARRLFGGLAATEAWERLRAGGPEVDPWRDLVKYADPERDLDDAAATATRFIIPGDNEWPEHLDALDGVGELDRHVGPPYGLWVRGDTNLRQVLARSIAIVGTRRCSDYGADVTHALATGLVDHEITVVSGGHYGVDTVAHQGALSAGGRTVAIRAAGIGVRDFESDIRLLARIADEGVQVSEKPPGSPPNSLRHFARNRLIAAGTLGTVVPEADLDCEALNIAEWAVACRRPVLAVPGPIASPTAAGTHLLIRDHQAHLITDLDDVLDALPRIHTRATILVHRVQRLMEHHAAPHHDSQMERSAESQMERTSRFNQSPSVGTRLGRRSPLTAPGSGQSIDREIVDRPGIEL